MDAAGHERSACARAAARMPRRRCRPKGRFQLARRSEPQRENGRAPKGLPVLPAQHSTCKARELGGSSLGWMQVWTSAALQPARVLLRKGCDRAASRDPGAGEGTIRGPIGPGRCEPITGRPWVPIARLYSAYSRAGPPPEPARPPPGKRPPRRGARAALARTIEGQFGVGPTGRVDRTPAGP